MRGLNNMPMIVMPQTIGAETVPAIDARELHAFLGIGAAFKDWIARRIETYGFKDGEDFCSTLSESPGGRPSKEYAISLAMAKELAMVERGEKGRQARAYFLECERRAKAAAAQQAHALPAALDDRLSRIERAVAAQEVKAAALDLLTTNVQGAVCLTEAAKLLHQKPRAFQIWLCEKGWIFRARDWGGWQGYQRRVDDGHLCHVMYPIVHTNGWRELQPRVKVTPAGLRRLAELLVAEGQPTVPTSNQRPSPRTRA